MSGEIRFPFAGDTDVGTIITNALHRVVDPEMAIDIVELGLVYGVEADGRAVRARITMTSPACPVAEYIVDEIGRELRAALGEDVQVHVDLVWDPPWGPERLSERARAALDWD